MSFWNSVICDDPSIKQEGGVYIVTALKDEIFFTVSIHHGLHPVGINCHNFEPLICCAFLF